jgi:hypothetical protein
MFVVDRNLEATPLTAGGQVGYPWLGATVMTHPRTGEMILQGRKGLSLAIDTDRSGPEPCRAAL